MMNTGLAKLGVMNHSLQPQSVRFWYYSVFNRSLYENLLSFVTKTLKIAKAKATVIINL